MDLPRSPKATCRRPGGTRAGASSTATIRAGARCATSTKYERMIAFGTGAAADCAGGCAADLRLPGLPREKVLATVVRLLETTFIRVGNEEYARSNNSFGLTTLRRSPRAGRRRRSCASASAARAACQHQISVEDPTPGAHRPPLPGPAGAGAVPVRRRRRRTPRTIDSADVNDYLREAIRATISPPRISAPGPAPSWRPPPSASCGRFGGPGAVSFIRSIATSCAQCPVSPNAWGIHWPSAESLTSIRRSSRRTSTERCPPASARERMFGGGGTTGLRPEEAAVLALLERRETRDRRGATLAHSLRRSLRLVRGAKTAPARPSLDRGR